MTHLTSGINKAMHTVLERANVNYKIMDEGGGICCGRPMMLMGQKKSTMLMIEKNTDIILQSNADLLLVSCPICYKIFNEDYNLPIPVMHHSQFIEYLIDSGAVPVNNTGISAVYHVPCELGRNSGLYDSPRNALRQITNLIDTKYERENGLCCGGSIGNAVITNDQRRKITQEALHNLTKEKPDILVTACPLCKKTFAGAGSQHVEDIAEVFVRAIK